MCCHNIICRGVADSSMSLLPYGLVSSRSSEETSHVLDGEGSVLFASDEFYFLHALILCYFSDFSSASIPRSIPPICLFIRPSCLKTYQRSRNSLSPDQLLSSLV